MFQERQHSGGVGKPPWQWEVRERPEAFRAALGAWFSREGRDYPWRRTRDPYAILVSEVMLQQTQIATVLGRGYYARFLERFPDPAALAAAGDDELLKIWEGLGYYRRARMLRAAARAIESEHAGRFPRDFGEILALPGVGRYTAGAVGSFAFGLPAAVVDGNVARVLARLTDFRSPVDDGDGRRRLWELADELLDRADPGRHNSALMELGQRYCRTGRPNCPDCPVAAFCRAEDPRALPRKLLRAAAVEIDERVIFARRGDRVLLRKLGDGRRAGMWRLPEREGAEDRAVLAERRYGITKYRVTMRVHAAPPRLRARRDEVWQSLGALDGLAMPPADRAVLGRLLESGEEIA